MTKPIKETLSEGRAVCYACGGIRPSEIRVLRVRLPEERTAKRRRVHICRICASVVGLGSPLDEDQAG